MTRPHLLSIVAGLCLLFAMPASGLRSVGSITPAEAADVGLTVRATPSGPHAAWITVEFATRGKLKDYSHLELQIEEGGKPILAYAVLGEKRDPNGTVRVTFMLSRAYVPKVKLAIVTGIPSNHAENQVALSEFVKVAEIR
jgi:hypothetical protein